MATALAMALALGAAISARQGEKQKKPITNDDVIAMTSGGLSEPVVIGAIDANETNFDVSAMGLLALKKANVSDKIITAMTNAEARKHNPQPAQAQAPGMDPATALQMQQAQEQAAAAQAQAQAMMSASHNPMAAAFVHGMRPGGAPPPAPYPTAATVPSQLPKVLLLLDEQQIPMHGNTAQVAKTETKGGNGPGAGSTALNMASSMAPMAMSMGLQSMAMTSMNFALMANPATMMVMPAVSIATHIIAMHHGSGGPTVTYVWALPGRVSPFTMQALRPKFDIQFGDIVGVDPDQYEPVLVKLVQTKDNWRLVGASKDKIDMGGNDTRSTITQEPVQIVVDALGRGHDVVEVPNALEPGEYGLVLHPKKSEKKSAADQQALNNAGNLFLTVWDFEVPDSAAKPDSTKGDVKLAAKQGN